MAERLHDLVAFDVDGTLIRHPQNLTVWEVLNGRLVGDASINGVRFEDYRAGKISYADWVELDVSGWRDAGATRQQLIEAFEPLELVAGAREAMTALREHGVRLVAISGTLDLMLNTLFPDHPFEEVYCNHIGFDEQDRISHWRATPFDMGGKATLLRTIAMREGIPLRRCAFVGDSDNDAWIAETAGLFVAFNPKSERVEKLAGVIVRSDDLRDILPHLISGSRTSRVAGR